MILTTQMIRDKVYFLGSVTKDELARLIFDETNKGNNYLLDSMLDSMVKEDILTETNGLYSTNNLKLN